MGIYQRLSHYSDVDSVDLRLTKRIKNNRKIPLEPQIDLLRNVEGEGQVRILTLLGLIHASYIESMETILR